MSKTMNQLIEMIRNKERELSAARKAEERAAKELEGAAKELSSLFQGVTEAVGAIKEEPTFPARKKSYRKGFLMSNKRRKTTANHLLKLGMTPSQVAKKLGCSSSSVYWAIKKGVLKRDKPIHLGPPSRDTQSTPRAFERKKNVFFNQERIKQAREMRAEGKGPTEIGRVLGCGEATVRYRIRMGDI